MKFLTLLFICILSSHLIELEKRSLLSDKIELLVPKGFETMKENVLELKYPNQQNRPTFVLTNDNATVNIAFNHLPNSASQGLIENYKNSIKTTFQNSFPNATWRGDGIAIIHGKKVGFLKLITEAVDQRVYNYIFMTDVDNRLLLCTFNCTEKLLPKWEATAEQIIQSLQIK